MVKRYKRSILNMLIYLISAPFAGGAAALILSLFWDTQVYVYYAVGGGVCLLVLLSTIFSDNISFEIEGTKLRHYRGKKLLNEYELVDAEIGYNIKQSDSTDRVDLLISGDVIDCAPLGLNKFYKMFADIEKISGVSVQKVDVQK